MRPARSLKKLNLALSKSQVNGIKPKRQKSQIYLKM